MTQTPYRAICGFANRVIRRMLGKKHAYNNAFLIQIIKKLELIENYFYLFFTNFNPSTYRLQETFKHMGIMKING
ncbi:hypothetical protein LWM68_28960 [Niabella sp. W65]|nr:hypothetical protein [Niabella sp. W65]MCH7366446.1 hypothetical protein [Niabella sp. W65]ULT42167.1 hypothetical protein KRR40_00420 [Niabella sp. I65]